MQAILTVLSTLNPNGNVTGMAEMAAEALSAEILSRGELPGRLNKK